MRVDAIVMTILHCQLDWIWNHLGDTPLGDQEGVSREGYLRRESTMGVSVLSSREPSPTVHKKEQRKLTGYKHLSLFAS